jgi:hypothetical protein
MPHANPEMVEAWAFVRAPSSSCHPKLPGRLPRPSRPVRGLVSIHVPADNRVQNTRREMHFAESGGRSASEWAGMAVAWGSFWLPTAAKMRSSLNPAIFWGQNAGVGWWRFVGRAQMSPARTLVTPVRPDT